jgi:hypothetical protein
MGCSCQMCPDEPLYAADPRGQQISQMPAHIRSRIAISAFYFRLEAKPAPSSRSTRSHVPAA